MAISQIQLALLTAYAYGRLDKQGNPDASSPSLAPGFENMTREVPSPYYPPFDQDCGFRALILGKNSTDQFGIYLKGSYSDLAVVIKIQEPGDPATGKSVGFLADAAHYGFGYLNSVIAYLRERYQGVTFNLSGSQMGAGIVTAYMAACQYSGVGDGPDLSAVAFSPEYGVVFASALGVPDEFLPGVQRVMNYISRN